jgi:hypothetical protein
MPKLTPRPAHPYPAAGIPPDALPGSAPRHAEDAVPAAGRQLGAGEAPSGGPRPASSWAARYGQAILRDGIATIPRALYLYQAALDLAAPEVWFASAVLAHKWDADLPHPSLRRMVAETGVSLRQLQNLRAAVCSKDLLAVYARCGAQGGQESNSYDFGGLFTHLEQAIQADPAPANTIQADGVPIPGAEAGDTSFVARYGRVIAQAGLIAVPAGLYTHQAALGLRPQGVWFVTYILAYRWSTELPYPSLRKMAARTGYSEQRLHEIKGELEAQGYLRVVTRRAASGGQDSNAYDFSGLLEALTAQLHPAVSAAEITPAGVLAPPGPRHPRRGRARIGVAGPESSEEPAERQASANPVQSPLVPAVQSDWVSPAQSPLAPPVQTRLWASGQNQAVGSDDSAVEVTGDAEKWGALRAEELGTPHAEGLRHPGAERVRHPRAESLPHPRAESLRRRRSDQEESDQEEDSNRWAPIKNRQDETALVTYSPYIAGVVLDYSRELGDAGRGPANVRQALRLRQESRLAETEFVEHLHEARRRVRYYQGAQGPGSIANKMAYFFRVLESLIHPGDRAASAGEQRPNRVPGDSSRADRLSATEGQAGAAAPAQRARHSGW